MSVFTTTVMPAFATASAEPSPIPRARRGRFGHARNGTVPAAQLANVEPHTGRVVERRRSASSRAEGVREDRLGTRLGVSQTLYGLQPHWGPLVAPPARAKARTNLNYQARRRSSGGTFGIGGQSEGWQMTRRVDLRLDNTLWAKLQRGEDEDKVRIGQLNVSTAYDMEDKKASLNRSGRQFEY